MLCATLVNVYGIDLRYNKCQASKRAVVCLPSIWYSVAGEFEVVPAISAAR